jgi:hypothetical protein
LSNSPAANSLWRFLRPEFPIARLPRAAKGFQCFQNFSHIRWLGAGELRGESVANEVRGGQASLASGSRLEAQILLKTTAQIAHRFCPDFVTAQLPHSVRLAAQNRARNTAQDCPPLRIKPIICNVYCALHRAVNRTESQP